MVAAVSADCHAVAVPSHRLTCNWLHVDSMWTCDLRADCIQQVEFSSTRYFSSYMLRLHAGELREWSDTLYHLREELEQREASLAAKEKLCLHQLATKVTVMC